MKTQKNQWMTACLLALSLTQAIAQVAHAAATDDGADSGLVLTDLPNLSDDSNQATAVPPVTPVTPVAPVAVTPPSPKTPPVPVAPVAVKPRPPAPAKKICDAKSSLCIDDHVISGPYRGKYYAGVIKRIDTANGLVEVSDEVDGQLYRPKISEVSKSIPCDSASGICRNDKVISGPFHHGKYYTGRVISVYEAGFVRVQDDYDQQYYVVDLQFVSKATP